MKEQTNKRTLQANIPVRIQSTLHGGMAGTLRDKANIEEKEKKKRRKIEKEMKDRRQIQRPRSVVGVQ